MLELCGAAAISGGGSPFVGPKERLIRALADHGLDGEGMARRHDPVGLIIAVVQDVGVCVEDGANSMSTKISHRFEPKPAQPRMTRTRRSGEAAVWSDRSGRRGQVSCVKREGADISS